MLRAGLGTGIELTLASKVIVAVDPPGISGIVNPSLGSTFAYGNPLNVTVSGTKDNPFGRMSWKDTFVKGLIQVLVNVTV